MDLCRLTSVGRDQEQGGASEGGAVQAQQAAVLDRGADQETAARGGGSPAPGGLPVGPGLQGRTPRLKVHLLLVQ